MNQDNKYGFPFEEEPNQQSTSLEDVSEDIAADVEAIMEDMIDPNVEIGIGFDAIMAEAGDPSLEIGADVEAIMQEAAETAGANDLPEAFPTDAFAEPAAVEVPTPTEDTPADLFSAIAEDTETSAESTCFFHIPEDTESVPQEVDIPAEEQDIPAPVAEAVPEEAVSPEAVQELSDDATQRIDVEDPLYHDLLNDPVVGAEIDIDETAISGSGLIHPADAELEQIIAETKAAEAQQPILEKPTGTLGDTGTISSIDIGDMIIQDYEDPSLPPEQPEKKEEPEKPLPKRRPRMKKGYGFFGLPHLAATLIWLAITIAIGVSLGRIIWVCAAEVLAFGKPDQEYTITITSADNIDTVATKLKNAGLIKYPELFKLYAGITEAEEELSTGTFILNTKYDYNALVKAMTYHSTARETVKVMIPEGYTCAQIFALLEEKGVCTVAELEEYAAHGEIKDRWFLVGIQRGDKYCLEGYLFPDSYEFYTNDEPGRVLGKFLDNFDARFTPIMKEKIDPLNQRMAKVLADRGYSQDYIDAHMFTIREIVIIASMIERETANDAESYDISSVIYNRLTNPKEYLYLNIDATIIYALGGNIDPVTGKTKPLTKEDLQLDSPYNTYTNPGLIPGPISNPGRNSLNAALDPNVTAFYFYVYNPNISKHLFATTKAEHDKNVAYVRSLEENS